MTDVLDIREDLKQGLRENWGWFVAVGAALLLLGIVAFGYLLAATIASVLVFATLMLAGAVAQIIHAFRASSWGRMVFWLLAGLLYAAGGVIAVIDPLLASAVLTLMLGVMLIASGVFRIIAGFDARPVSGWGWIVAGGVITLLLGALITIGWPGNTFWVIGLFLAVDLIYQGAAWLALGLAARKL